MQGTIMLVEDEADLRLPLKHALESAGYRVRESDDGTGALAQLRDLDAERPDMILLDLMMPGLDGWSLRLELLKDPILARIPILLISGTSQLPQTAMSLGAAGFLKKPFTMDELQSEVHRHWVTPEERQIQEQAIHGVLLTALDQVVVLMQAVLAQGNFSGERLLAQATPIMLPTLLETLVENLQPRAAELGVELEATLLAEMRPLQSDAYITGLVLETLLTDSLERVPGGHVQVVVFNDHVAHHVRLAVLPERFTRTGSPAAAPASGPAPHPSGAPLKSTSLPAHRQRPTPGLAPALQMAHGLLDPVGIEIAIESHVDFGHTLDLTFHPVRTPNW